MSENMTALVATPEHVWEQRTVPIPSPRQGQVLIRARAAALNNADVTALDATERASAPDRPAEKAVAGYEAAGVIEAVGQSVDEALIGTRLMTATARAFAQYVLADHRHTLPVPDTVTFEDAATLPTALLTEHGAMRAGGYEAPSSSCVAWRVMEPPLRLG
jgi:NADPH:quinone reductase